MFHDELLHNLKELCSAPRFDDPGMQDTLQGFIEPEPAVFYYDASCIDQVLLDTAREFYEADVLRLPFETCFFIKTNAAPAGSFTPLGREVDKSGLSIAYMARRTEDGIQAVFTHSTGEGAIEVAELKWGQEYNPTFYRFMQSDNGITDEQLRVNVASTVGNVLAGIMLINSKFTNKQRNEVPEKVNIKRDKKSKPRLSPYTMISLRDYTVSRELGGTHASPKPHWRRGHIRTLQSGKRIPIEPCLVNWNGYNEVEHNVYKVRK